MSAKRYQQIGVFLLATAAFTVIAVALWFVLDQDSYVVYADGNTFEVEGSYETVGDVVSAAGLQLIPQDQVEPHINSLAHPDETISIRRARQITVQTDDGRRMHWTFKRSLGDFLNEIELYPDRTDQIYADGVSVSLFDVGEAAVPELVEIGTFMTVTIVDGVTQRLIRTGESTVGDAIREAGITVYTADQTTPALGSWLQPDMVITIQRSRPLTIQADGKVIQTRSYHTQATAVLAELGVGLVGYDYALPADSVPLQDNDTIQVIRVTEDFEVIDEPLPFESLFQPTDAFELDERGLLQAGVAGIQRTRLRVRYENGVRVSDTPDGSWLAQEAIPEIIGYGTRVVVRTIDTPEGPVEYYRLVKMRVTAYMAQTSGKAADHPAYGITASGVVAGYGVVAVDPRVVPFRSNVYVPNYGVAFVGDTGGGVKGRWIDLGYEDDWDTFEHWSGYVDVYYMTPVPEEINYLLPTVLP